MTDEPNEPYSLIEEELTIIKTNSYDTDIQTHYNLETLRDAKNLVTLLNSNAKYQRNLSEHHHKRYHDLKAKYETIKEISNHKTEAINTIQEVYELRSKETDFNTQIIALIKLDCIKEIKKQYELIKLREQGGTV